MKLFKILVINITIFSNVYGQWSELVGLNTNNKTIQSICSDFNGNIYAAGDFTNSQGKHYVAKYDGIKWSELGGINSFGSDLTIYSIVCDTNGNLYASAGRNVSSVHKPYVVKYDGSKWIEVGNWEANLNTRWSIYKVYLDSKGNLYAAGSFTNSFGKSFVAKFNGLNWIELGGSLDNSLKANANIQSICSDLKGNIYAAGYFTNSIGKAYVAKFDGTKWSELIGKTTLDATSISEIVCDKGGNIYANIYKTIGINSHIVKFDGADWIEISEPNSLEIIHYNAICIDSKDKIYVAVRKTNNTEDKSYVQMYNGSNWSILGGNSSTVDAKVLCTDNNSNIYAASRFVSKFKMNQSSVKQLFNNSLFSLYTNPIEKTIYLIANDELFYTDYFIYDKSGKLLMSGKIKSEVTTINTDNLSNGNYFMTIANKFMQSFCVSKK